MKRRLLGILGWSVAVVAATTIGLTAVSLLSEGLTNDAMTPISHETVTKTLASTSPDTPINRPTPRPSTTTQTAVTRSLSSPGGTVIARCTGNTAYLLSWSPGQGWSVDDHARGPARSTLVKFEGDNDNLDDKEVTITVTCHSGEPTAAVVTTDD